MPAHWRTVTSGTPASLMVGTSGNSGLRRSSSTASGRKRPSFAFDTALPVLRNEECTRPARMSGLSGPSPLYGTCSICIPVALMQLLPVEDR